MGPRGGHTAEARGGSLVCGRIRGIGLAAGRLLVCEAWLLALGVASRAASTCSMSRSQHTSSSANVRDWQSRVGRVGSWRLANQPSGSFGAASPARSQHKRQCTRIISIASSARGCCHRRMGSTRLWSPVSWQSSRNGVKQSSCAMASVHRIWQSLFGRRGFATMAGGGAHVLTRLRTFLEICKLPRRWAFASDCGNEQVSDSFIVCFGLELCFVLLPKS